MKPTNAFGHSFPMRAKYNDALGLVFSNKEDFTKVGGRSGVVSLRTRDDANYKADLRLCGRIAALYMHYVE